MAYNKRNWKARQGTGLNYFSIDGATPVPIVNQPTTLTEAGDALSAGNLNDWEQRIEDAFDDADASIANVQGNLETYETTNDMRVAANSQDIQNIQNALSGTVIQEHVDSTQKNVKTILSADELLPWAILKRVGARSTQFNQLVENGNFASDSGWTVVGATITTSGNIATITVTSDGLQQTYRQTSGVPVGHKVYVSLEFNPSASCVAYARFGDPSTSPQKTCTANTWNRIDGIKTITAGDIGGSGNIETNCMVTTATNGDIYQLRRFVVYDLTAMNEYDSNKTDAENIASFRVKFPASYYPFNAGDIYDVPPLSFLYRGTNQWDEVTKLGYYDVASGGFVSRADGLCSENDIDVEPSTVYYLVIPSELSAVVLFYDKTGNYLNQYTTCSNSTFTTPANCHIAKMYFNGYGTTYNHNVMICLNSVTDKTYKPFIGQTIDTSFMAGKKYVNSSCYDYAENIYVNGILKRKNQTVVGSVDLGTLNYSYYTEGSTDRFVADVSSLGIKGVSVGQLVNALCSIYTRCATGFDSDTYPDKSFYIRDGYYLHIIDSAYTSVGSASDPTSFLGHLQGVMMYYELATLPDPTYGDPIPNFPCEDGSTITAITPQTDIVNAIDVPSTIGYSTKIA